MSLLKLEDVGYSYGGTQILEGVNLEFEPGKAYAIVGEAGSGKATLLSLLSRYFSPTSGKIFFNGRNVNSINKYAYRTKYIGMIYQMTDLPTAMTALSYILLAIDIADIDCGDRMAYAYMLLNSVGIEREVANRSIAALSKERRKRVTIAKTLCHNPQIILTDTLSDAADKNMLQDLATLLRKQADNGKCVITLSDSPLITKEVDVVYELKPARPLYT